VTSRPSATGRTTIAVLAVLALLPVRGLFTTGRLFFVRDLGFFFWSRHLWLRHTIFGGELPLWNPYTAAGHAAYADALNQIFMPLTLVVRLLPSDVVSFNLWIALPLPVATLGMFGFLRRRLTIPASALGACGFALSGAMVSSLNAPNLSWSLALLPWLCWMGDRLVFQPSAPALVSLAVVAALQALSGEPVTLAASVIVLAVCSTTAPRRPGVRRTRALTWVLAALAIGAALSAVQMLPTTAAGIHAGRAAWSETPDFWSLHPLAALEAVVPHLFGNYYSAFLADLPWMTALNSGREPFFYSIYVGPLIVLLACAGAAAYPRRSAPWLVLLVIFGIAAAGQYTPIYPAVRRLFHPLAFFRFPIKYLAVAFFALAVLAAYGCEGLYDPDRHPRIRRTAAGGGALATLFAALVIVALAAPSAALHAIHQVAARIQVSDPDAAAAFLLHVGEPLASRSIGLLLAGAGVLALAAGEHGARRRTARMVLLALCAGDLAISNGSLNPTVEVSKLRPPAWYEQLASRDRIYVGGRLRGFMDADDPDGSPGWDIPAEPSAIAGRAVLNAELPMEPSGWKARESVSYDLPVLLPAEYGAAMHRFVDAGPFAREAFLRRSGVRWCVLPEDFADGRIIAKVPDWHMIVTECNPAASRIFVATSAEISSNFRSQQDALFDPSLADSVLRIDATVDSAPGAEAADRLDAAITKDWTNEVELAVSLPQDAFVVLRDSYDPGWRATVDGAAVDVLRADTLFRAVHVRAGRHVIRFVYRPRMLVTGLSLSGIAIVFCCFLVLPRRKRPSSAEAGFTLLELMVVMALIGILLAIAFARYQGMRARADEASADSALRTIATAQWTFALTCGREKYATTLPALAQPIPSTGQAFLGPDLTGGEQVQHSGYLFQMAAKPIDDAPPSCSGVPVAQGYAVTADPISPGVSGTRFLAINADRVVYADETQTFTGNMPESGAPEHGTEVRKDK